jgi:hypothetical protein
MRLDRSLVIPRTCPEPDRMPPSPPTPSSAPSGPPRRQVRYLTLSSILDDAAFLANHQHQTVGNWNLAQILQHLADAMNYSIDGFPFKVNPVIRLIVKTFYKKRLIESDMPSGVKLPKRAETFLPKDTISVSDALANLKAAIARFETEDPTAMNPFLGKLTREEWIRVHLNHAALHMSFAKPA